MILILSTRVEQSTTHVIKWLNFLNKKWFRINKLLEFEIDYSIKINASNNNSVLKKEGCSVALGDITSVWYRRRQKPLGIPLRDTFDAATKSKININIHTEEQALFYGLTRLLDDKKWLSHPDNSNLNKLYQLDIATKLGLTIPDTILTSNKDFLLKFRAEHKDIIIKNIRDLRPVLDKNTYYIPYVKTIEDSFLDQLPSQFFPTLVQKCIKKQFELRVFFIGGKIFSMAMFSQEDSQTAEDFRRYNNQRPTRRVRYQLPQELEDKIGLFMKEVGLNTGSLDFIYSDQDEYIFLEVNPVGQFGMVSHPCNYNLNKEIALYLSEKQ
jgi:ATP-GRASP peptide maturase of grasp-with-spasm system